MARRTVTLWALPLASIVVLALALPVTAQSPPEAQDRGLVHEGLSRPATGRCAGMYKVQGTGGKTLCTTGPDMAPPGVDLSRRRSVKEFRSAIATASFSLADSSGPDGVPCIGNGTSGPRIQAVYAVPSDLPDRFGAIAPVIQEVAGLMDAALLQSAAETGGERHLRFVTNPDCTLNVAHVTLSASGDDTFGNTIDELIAQGYDQPGRKYHIWVDTSGLYCGIANQYGDDRPGPENLNNTATLYARTDSPCWGAVEHGPFTVELHEVFHTLGAVQASAPNATPYGHCTDEWDVMCYQDSDDTVLEYICNGDRDHLLDCNHDDYFHTSPSPGSYLATNWNTANSQFLSGSLSDPPPALPPTTRIVDDKQSGFIKYGGGWTKQPIGWKGRSYWVPVRKSSSNRYAVWKAPLDAPGSYEVWVRYPKKNATTRSAKYKVFTSGGVVTRTRNQKATTGRWVKLGAFDFGTQGKVKLTDRTGERTPSGRRIVFDAVRFVPVSLAGGSTVTVGPKVSAAPASAREAKLRLYPKAITAVVGARKSVSAWTCPADDTSPFGRDGEPGTRDDACDPTVAEWEVQDPETARVTRTSGHKTLVQLTAEADNRLTAIAAGLTRNATVSWRPRPAAKAIPAPDPGVEAVIEAGGEGDVESQDGAAPA